VFALNLKDKNWQLLGSIDNQDIYNPDEPVLWSGRYFFQCNDNFLLIVDPEQNRILKYNDGKSIFTSIINIDNKTLLVRYGKFNSKYVRESFAIENILREAKYVGPFYIDHTISWQTYCELGFGILAIIGFLGYSVRRRKGDFILTNSKGSSLDLTNSERTVLTVLVSNGRNGALSALQLNSILNIEDKSQDNQRKIRNNFIVEINRKIELKYRIVNGVGRKPLDEDKRLTLYYLQEEAFDLFSKLIPA
jgi:hypothetical protein